MVICAKNLEFDKAEHLYITDKNKLSKDNIIKWGYHVAPVLLAQNKKKVDTLVFDPSLNRERPLKIKEWFSLIGNSDKSGHTFLKPEQYFFYVKYHNDGTLSDVISGCFYKYEGDTKLKYYTLENGLALNDMAISIYNKHIKPFIKVEGDLKVE